MIVAGGVWDQPWPDWVAARYAGYIAYLIEQERSPHYDMMEMKDEDLEILLKVKAARMRLAANDA